MTLPVAQDTETLHKCMDSSSSSLPTVTIDKSMCESPETTSVLLPPAPKQDEVRGHSTIAPATTERFQLEDYTPFSRSHLWKLMMSFYDRQGVDSWAHGIVPHFITSNTFIAKKYSQVFRAYLRDCMRSAALNPKEPLYIVELGTGSGKFSFYFLKALAEAEDVLDFPLDQIKYIMTDFTEQNFTFWTTHPALEPFVSRGMVDFAIFDATKDTELSLFHAKHVIQPHQLVNPIAIIANYLFDTLYHDLFQVDLQGVLKQGLISVGSKRSDESDPLHPDIIKRLFNLYKYEPIPNTFYGSEAIHLNAILQWYQDYYKDSSSGATLLVPIGALSAIERLSRLSQQERVVILSGDKGNNHPEHFRGLNDPHIAVHGSFSVMVNYHAIGIYCTSRGGFALHSPQEEASLKVSVFVLPGKNDTSTSSLFREGLEVVSQPRRLLFPHLVRAFEEDIVSFGPNDFFVVQKALKEESKTPSLKAVVALLKLSEWDPDTFYKFRDVLLDHSPSSAPKLKRDVARGMPLVWKNYYALDREKDIAFEIGRFFYGLQQYETALTFYQRSLDEMGLHHVTCHNMGLCYYSQRQLSIALSYFKQAHGLNPSYTKAATWWTRVQTELGQLAPTQPLTPQHPERGEGEDLIEFVLSDHEEEQARSSLSRIGLE